jgi:hypothetical protein
MSQRDVMDRERAEVPEHRRVRLFTLPEARRTYSVTRVYRVQPGDVLVALNASDAFGARICIPERRCRRIVCACQL